MREGFAYESRRDAEAVGDERIKHRLERRQHFRLTRLNEHTECPPHGEAFDASALVKRYVREAGSVMVRRLLASGIVATSRLSEVEVASGIIRRAREGAFTAAHRDGALAALQHDMPAFALVELIPRSQLTRGALLLRHPLRAGDAIQLASCLYLQRELSQPVPFVAFDQRLLDAARAEGVAIVATSRRRSTTRPRSQAH